MPRMLRRIYRIHVYKKVLPPAVRPFLPRPFETGGHTGTAIVHARGPSVRGATNACDPARITPNGDRPAERFRPASSKSLPRGQRPKRKKTCKKCRPSTIRGPRGAYLVLYCSDLRSVHVSHPVGTLRRHGTARAEVYALLNPAHSVATLQRLSAARATASARGGPLS